MANIEIDLDLLNISYLPALRSMSRHLVNVGGAGSGKSYFCADKCIFRMMESPGHRITVFRKVARTIKRSVWQLLRDRLTFWGIAHMCEFNKTDFTIRFINGSEIWCIGLDDQEKLKSITGMSSAWIEEATEFTPDDLIQINLRLRGDTPGYKQIMYSFNPISVMHHLKAKFFDNPPDECETYRTTYNDNRFIDDEYKREIEELSKTSKNLHTVYALGLWGVLEGLIYDPFPYLDVYPEIFDSECYGLDFGFNHPMALIHVGELDGEFYLSEQIYRSGMTGADLIREMELLNIPKSANIQCDEAKPDTIEELNRAGYYNAKACPKGKGSVAAGIDFLQSSTIYTQHSNVNLNREMQSYEWRSDRSGNPMDEPVKLNDDAMDALRYAIWGTFGKPKMKLERLDRATMGI